MDYKESMKTLEWNLAYSNLKLAEVKVLAFMICRQNYRDGTFAGSLGDMAKAVQISKPAAARAVQKLIEKELIVKIKNQQGAKPATYRIRDSYDLDVMHSSEEINPNFKPWDIEHEQKFGELNSEIFKVLSGCEKCENAETDDDLCEDHKYEIFYLKNRPEYKRYQIWLKDNPKPEFKIKTINGRVVQ